MDDLISKQDAKVSVTRYFEAHVKNQRSRRLKEHAKEICKDICFEIDAQPSAQKHGKWIDGEYKEPIYDLYGTKTWAITYKCSECGFIHTAIENFGRYSYCPNCVASMEEV